MIYIIIIIICILIIIGSVIYLIIKKLDKKQPVPKKTLPYFNNIGTSFAPQTQPTRTSNNNSNVSQLIINTDSTTLTKSVANTNSVTQNNAMTYTSYS